MWKMMTWEGLQSGMGLGGNIIQRVWPSSWQVDHSADPLPHGFFSREKKLRMAYVAETLYI